MAKGPPSANAQVKITMTLDEATSITLRQFMEREGYSNPSSAGKQLIQYALEEQPKNFPRGLWINVSNEARNYVISEMSKFLFDLARQLNRAADATNNSEEEKARLHAMGGNAE